MAAYTTINSAEELDALTSANTFVLVDFWATWCPPCKAIAPFFADLASKNTIPAGLALAKVDVDAQANLAKRYGISAMPTFLLLERGEVVKTVKGANPPAIKQLVAHAKKEIKKERKGGAEDEEEEAEEEEVEEEVEDVGDSTWFKDIREIGITFSSLFILVFAALYYFNRQG